MVGPRVLCNYKIDGEGSSCSYENLNKQTQVIIHEKCWGEYIICVKVSLVHASLYSTHCNLHFHVIKWIKITEAISPISKEAMASKIYMNCGKICANFWNHCRETMMAMVLSWQYLVDKPHIGACYCKSFIFM